MRNILEAMSSLAKAANLFTFSPPIFSFSVNFQDGFSFPPNEIKSVLPTHGISNPIYCTLHQLTAASVQHVGADASISQRGSDIALTDQLASLLIDTSFLQISRSPSTKFFPFSLDIPLIESDSDEDDSIDSMFLPSTVIRPRTSSSTLKMQQQVRQKGLENFLKGYEKRRYDVCFNS